jgi:anti-sigma B factor antagonist
MEIAERILEDVVILDLSDERFEYPKTLVLKNHVLHLMKENYRYFVLNLGGVQMLDSFGLAVIISILKLCKTEHGNLTLFGLNDTVSRLMEITHMDRVLDIWPTEGQALAHVKSSA